MIKKLGGRKVLLGLLILTVGISIELLTKKGLSVNMIYFLFGIGSAYFTANAATKFASKPSKKDDTNNNFMELQQDLKTVATDLTEVKEFVNETRDKAPASAEGMNTNLKAIANQNAVMMQTLNQVAGGMSQLLDALSQSKNMEANKNL